MDQTTTTPTPAPDLSTPLEITADPTTLRVVLEAMIEAIGGPEGRAASRELALARTRLQEARFWVLEHMIKA